MKKIAKIFLERRQNSNFPCIWYIGESIHQKRGEIESQGTINQRLICIDSPGKEKEWQLICERKKQV